MNKGTQSTFFYWNEPRSRKEEIINPSKSNKLFNGTCEDEEFLQTIEDNSIDVVFFSPPYNVGGAQYMKPSNSKTFNQSENKYTTLDDDRKDWDKWIEGVVRTWLDKAQYIFLNVQQLSGNKKLLNNLLYNLNDVYCDTIIWNKGRGIPNGLNKRVMTAKFEYIHIFSKKPSRAVGTKEWRGTVGNVIEGISGMSKNEYSSIHKAQFPIELPTYIFENFVKENGTVADIMMGLGTSGISAKKLGLNFIGVELDKEYYDIAKERIIEVDNG